jgi:hypothetical protein
MINRLHLLSMMVVLASLEDALKADVKAEDLRDVPLDDLEFGPNGVQRKQTKPEGEAK